MFWFLLNELPEFSKKNAILLLNSNNFRYFYQNLINYFFWNFYYKVEIKNGLLIDNSQQISLIIDSSKYIQQKTLKSFVSDWSIFYFVTLLDKKKEKIFLKHLFFNENYLINFRWLSLGHSLNIFTNKMY